MQDPDEFLNTLKTELFEDEVYVFTPKGKLLHFLKVVYQLTLHIIYMLK